MIKNLLYCLLFIFVAQELSAQQDIMMTNFMFDKLRVNPATTGVEEGFTSLFKGALPTVIVFFQVIPTPELL